MQDLNVRETYEKFVETVDLDHRRIFKNEDIGDYIVGQMSTKETYEEMIKVAGYIEEKIVDDFFFAFEHAATRVMGLSLFTIGNDLKRQHALMSSAVSEGDINDTEAVSKQITQLETRYNSTVKQITSMADSLAEKSSVMTLADREKEYYIYKMGKKKGQDEKDLKEERMVIAEKMKENAALGLPKDHGLQSILSSDRHAESIIDPSGNIKDRSRHSYIKGLKKHSDKRDGKDKNNT